MKKSIHSKRSLVGGICLLVVSLFFVLKSMPATNAALRTLAGGTTQRDNSNFINQDFWNDNPSTGDIITALYGSGDEGTAYTQNWSGYSSASCLNAGMSVIETDTLPVNLLANTIYVLTGEQVIVDGTRNLANCSVVISKNTIGTTFFSSDYIINGGIFALNYKQYAIMDAIAINGTDDGIGGIHTGNGYGIFLNNSTNNSINNSQVYNNYKGISLIRYSNSNSISNSQVYNNSHMGIHIYSSFTNTINNCQSYNNYAGVYLQYSDNNSINNTQIYNNAQSYYGLEFDGSSNNILNNSQIYNNQIGININDISLNNIIHDTQSYNNNDGIRIDSGASATFYGTTKIFGNTTNITNLGSGNLFTGYASDSLVQSVNRSDGILVTTGTMSRDYITNPINTSGNYLLSWSDSWENIKFKKTNYSGSITDTYSFGSGILLQAQPVLLSGTTLINAGAFDSNKYIGSDVVEVTGMLLGLPTLITTVFTFDVLGDAVDSLISHYSLLGDITDFIFDTPKGTNKTITILPGEGKKRVVTQLFGNTYFATHFQSDTLVDQNPPTTVKLISPLSGITITTGNVALVRSAAIDSGAGISGYIFEGINSSGNVAFSEFTINTGVTLSLPNDELYTRKVYAIDNIGNTGAWSDTWNFTLDTTICSTLWNNDTFISSAFWASNPTKKCVIEALYGSTTDSSTAYTQNWSGYSSGSCLSGLKTIETAVLPQILTANTIYVLSGASSIMTGATNMASCSVVVSKNTSGTTFFTTGYLNGGVFRLINKQHVILDNISINGNNDGIGGTHNKNNYGIYGLSSSKNITLNNLDIYNNLYGIYTNTLSYTTIANSRLYTNTNNGVFAQSTTNSILQNVSAHHNNVGIQYTTTSNNNILRNIQSYSNTTHGIYLSSSSNNAINNTQVYNNQDGIYFSTASKYNSINNSQSYNNNQYGILFSNYSEYNSINNTQVYNNNQHGIYFFIASNNSINNSQSYNNNQYGILFSSASNNSINNSQVYNNNYQGIHFSSSSNNTINNSQGYNNKYGIYLDSNSTGNIYYGKLSLFGNQSSDIEGATNNLILGNSNDSLTLSVGRTTGELKTGTMSRDLITNPINTAGNYLLSWSGSWSSLRGMKLSYSGTVTDKYSFGSGILLQAQPVIYDGTTLINSGSFDPTKYIGSDTIKVTGSLLGLPAMTSGLNFTLIGNSLDGAISNYSLFGDINSWKTNQPLGTSTGITLLAGDGTKRVVTQLFGNNYFATHFESDTLLDQTAPTQVSLVSPFSGTTITTGNISLVRSAAIDSGAGISGYVFEGINSSGNVAFSGFTTNTGVTLSLSDDVLYRRKVYATDTIGNTGAWSDMWNFTVDTLVCSTLWNNDNFINDTFWATNPAKKCVIEALYGSLTDTSTAYTQNWSGRDTTQCNGAYITVTETNNLPQTLTANTIYVLSGASSITTGATNMASCSAVISKNTSGTTFFTTGYLNGGVFTLSNKQHVILDNIGINGTNDGIGGIHTGNTYGIYLSNSANNNSINNSQFYNNKYGIYFFSSSKNSINNSQSYNNNDHGIFILSSSNNNSINNSQAYNNYGCGIYFFSSSNNNSINNSQAYNNSWGIFINSSSKNTINNFQAYNNRNVGIHLNSSSNNIINNSLSYNNKDYGIYLWHSSNNNSINNTQFYNNNYGISLDSNATGNKYYGKLSLFENQYPDIEGTASNLSTGYTSDSLVPSVGRTTGELITTGAMSRNLITNPINTAGNYLLSWSGSWSSIRGYKLAYSGTVTNNYSFGSGIFMQAQPVIYSGTTLISSGSFDPTKYIGSDTNKVTGSLLGLPAMTSGLNFTLIGHSLDGAISNYSLFGDINSWKTNQPLGTSTGITLLTGDGTKRVITQLFGNNYFATHFESDTLLDQAKPTFTFINTTGLESSPGLLAITNATDTGVGLSLTPYSWSTDGITRGPWTATTSTGLTLQDETTNTMLRVRVRDLVDNIHTGSATFTRTNTGPSNTTLINNGPTAQNNIITRTGFALDTGTTLSYHWYSGYDCSSHFLSSGSSNTLTGLLSLPGTLVRSLKVFDIQGSGGACITSTGVRSNIAPLATSVTASGNEFTAISITANAAGNNPLTYVWYSNTSCTSFLSTGQSYTPSAQNEPITINYYYTAADTFGGVSACTTGSITWNNIAPIANNLYQTGNQSDSISFTASGYDVGGTTFSYQRFSGNSCGGSVISTASSLSYTSISASTLVRSYKVFDAENSGSNCAIATGVWNDTIAPTGTIIYTPLSGIRTSGSVLATITGFNEQISGLNNTGFTFTDNGTFTFTFSDLAGNTGSTTAMVSWIDTIAPSQVTLISPTSGSVFVTGNVALVRSAAIDTGSGISGYIFEIYGSGYAHTGTIISTGITITGLNNGTYIRKIFAYDSVGHISSESEIWEFVLNTTCTLPRGGTINNGQSITAYPANTVACGASCTPQTRTCNNGILSGSFTQASCTVQSCGGGGTTIQKDDCSLSSTLACGNSDQRDLSPSYYDGTCCGTPVQTGHGAALSCDVSDSPYIQEVNDAFSRGYSLNITNKCPITTARLDSNITRIEAAKMISMFTIQLLGIPPDTKKTTCDKYNDTSVLTPEMKFFAKTACQLNLMGLEPDGKTPKASFDPKDFIDRAQFGTILSRLIYSDSYNIHTGEQLKYTWYEKHLKALIQDKIINDSTTPFALEKRMRVLLMLKRTYDNKIKNYRVARPSQNIAIPFISHLW